MLEKRQNINILLYCWSLYCNRVVEILQSNRSEKNSLLRNFW